MPTRSIPAISSRPVLERRLGIVDGIDDRSGLVRSRWPSAVSASPRVDRAKSLPPRCRSSDAMSLLTVGCAMFISRATAEKLPRSTQRD